MENNEWNLSTLLIYIKIHIELIVHIHFYILFFPSNNEDINLFHTQLRHFFWELLFIKYIFNISTGYTLKW